jgi:hypothetical protein
VLTCCSLSVVNFGLGHQDAIRRASHAGTGGQDDPMIQCQIADLKRRKQLSRSHGRFCYGSNQLDDCCVSNPIASHAGSTFIDDVLLVRSMMEALRLGLPSVGTSVTWNLPVDLVPEG